MTTAHTHGQNGRHAKKNRNVMSILFALVHYYLGVNTEHNSFIYMNGTSFIRIIHFMVVSNQKSSCPTILMLSFRRNIPNANTLFHPHKSKEHHK